MTFDGKSVLVTGGTGSFGQAFIRLLLEKHNPAKVIILSRDELKQYDMQALPAYQDPRVRFFIGDIRDLSRMKLALRGVDIVVHAAALKQVPACEYNPMEAVRTNITGAENLIAACMDQGVEKLLALSTDKAVSPANLYGATKQVMEKLFVQANAYSGPEGTRFACVRYGNVVGSRGSVVPLFLKQRETGKVTVTDERMTRFWITLDHGTQFVAECVRDMKGGEVFVPKLPSTTIMDLVEVMAPDCEVENIGIRPGEKLHEVMIGSDESRTTYDQGDRYVVQPRYPWWHIDVDGEPVEDGFVYASNTNDVWLKGDALQDLLSQAVGDA